MIAGLVGALLAVHPGTAAAAPPVDDDAAPVDEVGDGPADPELPAADTPDEDPPETPAPQAPAEEQQTDVDDAVSAPEEPPPEEVDLADPLAPVSAALDELEARGLEIRERREITNLLQGTGLAATISGSEQALLQYVLGRVADDGYIILLEPTGAHELALIARPARGGQARGVFFVNVDKVSVDGRFLRDEDPRKLERILDLGAAGLLPSRVVDDLRTFGYEAELYPVGPREVIVQVRPGRSIRRVRIRGHVPLARRDVERTLSPAARPGALARGRCVSPKALRADVRPPICADDDLTCKAWERDEVARLDRFLFDNGYLRGRASLGLTCGRAHDEADLHVFLEKGEPYRVTRKRIKITGNVSTQDQRWINWLFRPKVSPFLPIPRRISRKHIEDAKDKVEREYAEPKTGAVKVGAGRRRELELPYPGVRIETSFDDLSPDAVPKDRKLTLDVDVQLGNGVQVAFFGNDRIGDGRLLSQLQLFKRREPANEAAARREAANLRSYYQSRGFLLASVEARLGAGFGSLKLQQLTFVIDEGPRFRLRKLELRRPDGVPDAVADRIERDFHRDRKLRRNGRFSDANALSDLRTLLAAYNARGYLCATARVSLSPWRAGLDAPGEHAVLELTSGAELAGDPQWITDQLDLAGLAALRRQSRANAYARIEVVPGPRVLTSGREEAHYLEAAIPAGREVDGIPERTQGDWGLPRMLRDGPLRRRGDERAGGIPITLTLDRDVERDVIRRYRRSGYPIADAELRWSYASGDRRVRASQADRLAELGLCRDHAGKRHATIDAQLYVYEGKRGQFGTTLLRGNFKTRKYVLRREIEWDPDDVYDEREVDRTAAHIDRTGVAESVRITPYPIGCELSDEGACEVNHVVSMTEAKDVAMDLEFGVGLTTLDPLYGFVAPTFPNLWGTAWDLQLAGHWGVGLIPCDDEKCFERSARASLVRRRILASPLDLDLTGQIQRRVTPARGQIDSALGTARLSWPISDEWRIYVGYLIQLANISKDLVKPVVGSETDCGSQSDPCTVINRGEAIVPDRTGALETGAVWETVDNRVNPHDGFLAQLDFMLASPWLAAWDWWMRFDLTWMHFIPLPRTAERLSFGYSLRYGHAVPLPGLPGTTTTSIPEVWRYFGGGTVDLGLRGIQPQTMLVDVEEIDNQFGVTTLRPTAQGGHIRALATMALRVVSVRKFLGGMLAHSLFFDFGVLTQRWKHVRFGRDFRRSVGINFLMWDIPNMITMSLGYAILIPDEIWPGGNVRPTDDPNGRLVFDVGVTF